MYFNELSFKYYNKRAKGIMQCNLLKKIPLFLWLMAFRRVYQMCITHGVYWEYSLYVVTGSAVCFVDVYCFVLSAVQQPNNPGQKHSTAYICIIIFPFI